MKFSQWPDCYWTDCYWPPCYWPYRIPHATVEIADVEFPSYYAAVDVDLNGVADAEFVHGALGGTVSIIVEIAEREC